MENATAEKKVTNKRLIHHVDRKYHLMDASGKILGRLATSIAVLLMGKHKTVYRREWDMGDFVKVTNCAFMKYSGNKLLNKIYYRHSKYLGGLKSMTLRELHKKSPSLVLQKAVFSMLPNNRLRKNMMKRLDLAN